MNESILETIKKMLGITEDYTHFDEDIIVQINAAFTTLNQLGVGPLSGFVIMDKYNTWSEFVLDTSNISIISTVKSYIYKKVRLAFDPPQNGSLLEALKQQIEEDTWRLSVYKSF